MALTILDIVQESESRLQGVDSPLLSSQVLVAHVLGCTRLMLTVDRDCAVTDEQLKRIRALVDKRVEGEPLAYILGTKEFYGLDFKVTPDTLIPRPETEHIIEALEEIYPKDSSLRFADLGTGSGILAVMIGYLFPYSSGLAFDLSGGALTVARENAAAHGVENRVEFHNGDFTKPLLDDESLDLIVSNPPYVPQQEYDEASFEVTGYEPVTALVSGDDGLDHIRAMLPLVGRALKSGGRFLMEIGYQQAEAIKKIILTDSALNFREISILSDLAGHDRVVLLQK